jgi:hypothetical protein
LRKKSRKPTAEWSPVGNFIETSLKKLGVRQAVQRVNLEDWCRGWLGEAGSRSLARVTVKKNVVTWEFRHPAWVQELQGRKTEAFKALREAYPREGYEDLRATLARQ